MTESQTFNTGGTFHTVDDQPMTEFAEAGGVLTHHAPEVVEPAERIAELGKQLIANQGANQRILDELRKIRKDAAMCAAQAQGLLEKYGDGRG